MTNSPIRPVSDEHKHVSADYEVDTPGYLALIEENKRIRRLLLTALGE